MAVNILHSHQQLQWFHFIHILTNTNVFSFKIIIIITITILQGVKRVWFAFPW